MQGTITNNHQGRSLWTQKFKNLGKILRVVVPYVVTFNHVTTGQIETSTFPT